MRAQLRRAAVCMTAFAITTGTGFVAYAAPSSPSSPVADQSSTVRLITGDAVRVTPHAGGPRLALLPRDARHGTGLAIRRLGSHTYVVPTSASRYLGRVLDPALFDVTATPGRQVVVSATGGAAVPGLTVTSRRASTQEGYFTPAGARSFGAALDRQWHADLAAHRVPTTLFGGVTHLAATGVTLPVTPAFPQQTLTVKALDTTGKPAEFASLALVNVDDSRKFGNFLSIEDGLAKVSVPVGHYAGFAEVIRDDGGDAYSEFFVPVEGIEVTAGGGTVTVDARTATTVPAVHTPRPATVTDKSVAWVRSSGTGGLGSSYELNPDTPVYVAPTPKVTRGRLDWVTGWALAGTPADGRAYTYDISFHDAQRVPADQDRTVRPGQVARIDASYYADNPYRTGGYFGRGALYPFGGGGFFGLNGFANPSSRTEYVAAPADAVWYGSLLPAPNDDDPFQGAVDDGGRSYTAGSTQRADWLRGPLAPGFVSPGPADEIFFCGYCRDAGSMVVAPALVADTDPAHTGYLDLPDEDSVISHFRLYRDGKVVHDEDNVSGAQVDVPPGSATYRAVASTSRGLAGFGSSTTASTDVTFTSSATSGNAAPASWVCPGDGRCTALPVLTTSVPLPTDLVGTMRQGTVPMTIRVGHAAGAADPAITAVSVALSFDGGRTYAKVPVTSVDNHTYTVSLTNPASAAGKRVAIRVYATDAAGGKLTQTAVGAYAVAR